ncbi:hypothetical protein, partial [Limosilactobacillus fermentum]|uniref:hypothetical protein n=1 Tax=Limosilactobacillus fermentum TaxID=1613 RepID=UPI0021A8F828
IGDFHKNSLKSHHFLFLKVTTFKAIVRKVWALLFLNVRQETCEITAGLVSKQDEERCVAHQPFALT